MLKWFGWNSVPAFLVAAVPLKVLWYGWGSSAFFDVFIHPLENLSLVLIIPHLYSWSKKGQYGPNQLRYIDYIYLTAPTFGLFSAADFAIKSYDTELAQHIEQSKIFIRFAKDYYSAFEPVTLSLPKGNNDCELVRKIIHEDDRALTILDTNPIQPNFAIFSGNLKNLADEISFQPQYVRHHLDSLENLVVLS